MPHDGSRQGSPSCPSYYAERNTSRFLMSAFGGKADIDAPLPTIRSETVGWSILSFGGAMRRREFITCLGSAAVASPLVALAQQSAMPIVGFLRSEPLIDAMHLVNCFRQGLKETGFIDGQNIAIEFRSADGHADRL